MEEQIGASEQPRFGILEGRLRCIVKLGGAAVTCKQEIEKINEEGLGRVSSHLREAMMGNGSGTEILGMDWSRRPGAATIDPIVDFDLHEISKMGNLIIVHGAGSFGHFQASRSGVHKGGLDIPIVKAGFVATRISVTSLSLSIVRALAREGIPAIGISPYACGWETTKRNTDVLGVYDRPPFDPEAVLLREIEVEADGRWSIVRPLTQGANGGGVEISVAAHDTTGGMETKISEAAAIARLGIDVFITKAGTAHALRALKGELMEAHDDNWLGTAIRSARKHFR